MTNTDIKALVERLRAYADIFDSDTMALDLRNAADALEACRTSAEKAEAVLANARNDALEEAARLVQRSGQSDDLIRIASRIRALTPLGKLDAAS